MPAASSETTHFLNKMELDLADNTTVQIFKNIQGNILKGHGRDHAVLIFLRFYKNKVKDARKLLGDFAKNHVTTFYHQLWERERFKRNRVPGGTFGALFLSRHGYSLLEPGKPGLTDVAFNEGMRKRAGLLNDPATGLHAWHRQPIHAMLLLADNDKARLNQLVTRLLEEDYKEKAVVTHVDYGDAIRNHHGDGLEHNGYVDGISQPLFLKDEVDEYREFHYIKNNMFEFDPRATPGLALVEDPYAPPGKHHYGSYFVFRKLEQLVRDFKRREEAIGEALYSDEEKAERIGARLNGRFEDGTPVQLQGSEKLIGSGAFNNFNYFDTPFTDPSGGHCPHFAHIRKTNPRNGKKFDEHAIVRRGIPFGHRNVSTEQEHMNIHQNPYDGVGLLFMCYQANIATQFEHIQKLANDPGNGGVDPIIGQGTRDKYEFPDDGDVKPKASRKRTFQQHTHFRGGEYFFAPSMAYLQSLG